MMANDHMGDGVRLIRMTDTMLICKEGTVMNIERAPQFVTAGTRRVNGDYVAINPPVRFHWVNSVQCLKAH